MQAPLADLARHQNEWGLELNWDKIQVVAAPRGKGCKKRFPNKGKVRFAGRTLGGHHTAKYLGTIISKTGSYAAEVRNRISKATAALVKVGRHMWNKPLPLGLKVQLYLALVRSILGYGLECTTPTKGQWRDLEHVQMRALRWLAKSPAHKSHETNEELRRRLQVPTVASWTRLTRLRWLQTALKKPEDHAQVLCALFGTLPWDPWPPTTGKLPYLAQLATDLEQVFGGTATTSAGHLREEYLEQLLRAPDSALQGVLTYHSEHERGAARYFGPLNAPTWVCDTCRAPFDAAQKLAVHQWAAHRTRNPWRAMVTTPQCPFCLGTFASVEIAKRHVTKNVCGLREPAPAASTGTSARAPDITLDSWFRPVGLAVAA